MSVYESIVQYDVANESSGQAYGKLLQSAVSNLCSSKEEFYNLCADAENHYMQDFHADNPDAKKKSGEWKFRTYLPRAYTTAKSVVGNALEHGIPLQVEGEDVGKSALEKAIREKKKESEEKDWDKLAVQKSDWLVRNWENINEDTRRSIQYEVSVLPVTS